MKENRRKRSKNWMNLFFLLAVLACSSLARSVSLSLSLSRALLVSSFNARRGDVTWKAREGMWLASGKLRKFLDAPGGLREARSSLRNNNTGILSFPLPCPSSSSSSFLVLSPLPPRRSMPYPSLLLTPLRNEKVSGEREAEMRGTKKAGKGRFRPLSLLLFLILLSALPSLLVPCTTCAKRRTREQERRRSGLPPFHYVALVYTSSGHPLPLLLSS